VEFGLKSIHQLFPTPLLRFEVADCAALNQVLLAEIALRRSIEEGQTRSNRTGWHSQPDLFDRAEPGHRQLATLLRAMIVEATTNFDPSADFQRIDVECEGWVNVNPRGAYNSPHDHPGAFWSGTYYVQVPAGERDAGTIEFIAPRQPLRSGGTVRGDLTADKARVRPTAGTVLLFPGSLLHWVHPNDSEEERVTIAFNARFRRKSR